MSHPRGILQLAVPFVWSGMVAAISLLETPLKFRAPARPTGRVRRRPRRSTRGSIGSHRLAVAVGDERGGMVPPWECSSAPDDNEPELILVCCRTAKTAAGGAGGVLRAERAASLLNDKQSPHCRSDTLRADVDPDGAVDLILHVQGRIGGGLVLAVHGELEFATVGRFLACVDQNVQHAGGALHADLHLVTFVDSSGVAALVTAHRRAQHAGVRLVIEAPTATLVRTLRMTGLADFFGLPPG